MEVRDGMMVHEYYVARYRERSAERHARIEALRTRADAEAYVREVRGKARRCLGPMPARTPLNPRITWQREHNGCSIEGVVFESRPGFLVTGNLYRPLKAAGGQTRPGILGLCGHAPDGKAHAPYQTFCQGLCRRGFIVLVVDPIEQGERRQLLRGEAPRHPGLCAMHNIIGRQLNLLGDFLGTWMAWDAIRALDLLCTLPDVDTSRIGVTGNSGGGLMTAYVSALDPRPKAVAPGCYITSWLHNMENELPADAEQNPPLALAAGLDEADLLACHAPRHTLVLAQQDDTFDIRGTRGAVADLRRLHRLLGHEARADLFVGPRGHGFHIENREAMYAFFARTLEHGRGGKEGKIVPLPPKQVAALPGGDTRRAGSLRVVESIRTTEDGLRAGRKPPTASRVRRDAARLLHVHAEHTPPPVRRSLSAEPSLMGVLILDTDPGIRTYASLHGCLATRIGEAREATVYVGHTHSDSDVVGIPRIRRLARAKTPFLAVHPRGTGCSTCMLHGKIDVFHRYGAEFLYTVAGEMLGESFLGRRTHDVMRVVDYLNSEGIENVRLIGRGLGSFPVLFAGLLHRTQPVVELIHYLPSYRLLIDNAYHDWPDSVMPRGVLKAFDLPDVHAALGGRLTLREPWNARMRAGRR